VEDLAHLFCFGAVDYESAVFSVIAEWHGATHPHALALGGSDLVADAFTCDFSLKLGEGQ